MRFQKAKKIFALLSVFLCLSLFLSVTAFALGQATLSSGRAEYYTQGSGQNFFSGYVSSSPYVVSLDYQDTAPLDYMVKGLGTVEFYDAEDNLLRTVNGTVNGINTSYVIQSGSASYPVPVRFVCTPSSGDLIFGFRNSQIAIAEPETSPLDPLFDNVGSASTSLFGVMGQVVEFVTANWVMLIPLLAWIAVLAFKSARKTYKG